MDILSGASPLIVDVRQTGSGPLADFLAYERAHGRSVRVSADPAVSDWRSWQPPVERPAPGAFPIQCCTDVYSEGCSAELVCHGTTAAVAAQALAEGRLRSAVSATGRSPHALAAAGTWGEPPDYFEHVMLANGRCTAPEAVAHSRRLGRDLVPFDLKAGYPPAVRFYFAWEALAARPDARFDGAHPVKVAGELPLEELMVAVVVQSAQLHVVAPAIPARLRRRLIVLEYERPRPEQWATAAIKAASALSWGTRPCARARRRARLEASRPFSRPSPKHQGPANPSLAHNAGSAAARYRASAAWR